MKYPPQYQLCDCSVLPVFPGCQLEEGTKPADAEVSKLRWWDRPGSNRRPCRLAGLPTRLSHISAKPLRAISGWSCLLHGDGYPIPRTIKRGRSYCRGESYPGCHPALGKANEEKEEREPPALWDGTPLEDIVEQAGIEPA